MNILRINDEIMLLNCIYKINRYKMSFCIDTKTTTLNTFFYADMILLKKKNWKIINDSFNVTKIYTNIWIFLYLKYDCQTMNLIFFQLSQTKYHRMLNTFCAFDTSKTTYSTNAKSISESRKSELSFSMKKSKKNLENWMTYIRFCTFRLNKNWIYNDNYFRTNTTTRIRSFVNIWTTKSCRRDENDVKSESTFWCISIIQLFRDSKSKIMISKINSKTLQTIFVK